MTPAWRYFAISFAGAMVAHGASSIVFDSNVKQYSASPGEMVAPFTFNLTNVSDHEIIIRDVQGSCGCTTARLPEIPWHLAPGAHGQVEAEVNLAGKLGLIAKTLTFFTSDGTYVVTVKVNVPLPPATSGTLSPAQRQAAMMQAASNAQAIFHGDCATCHVEKGRDAIGEELYTADCGICHESPHRANMVPDLHALKEPTDFRFWKTYISNGKAHSMMPGFAKGQGGPLSSAQIDSLAAYLDRTISHHF